MGHLGMIVKPKRGNERGLTEKVPYWVFWSIVYIVSLLSNVPRWVSDPILRIMTIGIEVFVKLMKKKRLE